MSINRVCVSGNMTRDAELRQTAGGGAVLTFSVAVNERRKNNKTGEWEDYPNYVECALYGARATKLERYLVKGTKVSIEGKIRQDRWEKDGQKRSAIKVLVDEIEFMSRAEKPKPEPEPEEDYGYYSDDDLPF